MLRRILPLGLAALVSLGFLGPVSLEEPVYAYWIWSKETGKWVNPRKVPKDTPREQFDHAKSFFDQADYERSNEEFDKLINAYPQNQLAAEAQFYKGLSYEARDDVGKAAEAFKVLVDRYPYSERVSEAIRHEYELAELMFGGRKTKVLGMEVMPAVDTAIQHFQHIVETAPFGEYGVKAQYRIGDAHLALGNYDDAERAFQAVIDEYPNSEHATKAQYQIARTAYRSSLAHEYHEKDVDQALTKFERFRKMHPESVLEFEANEAITELRAKKAQSLYDIAHFYQERRRFESARLYYGDVVALFPDTAVAGKAKLRLEEVEAKNGSRREGPLAFLSRPFVREKEEVKDTSARKEGVIGFITKPVTNLLRSEKPGAQAPPPAPATSPPAPQAPPMPAVEKLKMAADKTEGPLAIFSSPFSLMARPFSRGQVEVEEKPAPSREKHAGQKTASEEGLAKKEGPLAIFSRPFTLMGQPFARKDDLPDKT